MKELTKIIFPVCLIFFLVILLSGVLRKPDKIIKIYPDSIKVLTIEGDTVLISRGIKKTDNLLSIDIKFDYYDSMKKPKDLAQGTGNANWFMNTHFYSF